METYNKSGEVSESTGYSIPIFGIFSTASVVYFTPSFEVYVAVSILGFVFLSLVCCCSCSLFKITTMTSLSAFFTVVSSRLYSNCAKISCET